MIHERFIVHLQLCFVVSFVLRVLGLLEGVLFSGKTLGWTTGTLIWMPGARWANISSLIAPLPQRQCLAGAFDVAAGARLNPLYRVAQQALCTAVGRTRAPSVLVRRVQPRLEKHGLAPQRFYLHAAITTLQIHQLPNHVRQFYGLEV